MEKLPDELLCHLLDLVLAASDKATLAQSSLRFNKILDPNKPAWMMQLALPHIFKFLERKDIINMRTICRDWCEAVDAFLQSHPNLCPFDPDVRDPKSRKPSYNISPIWKIRKLRDEIRFRDVNQLLEFSQDFQNHETSGRNPIPTRSVALNPTWDEQHNPDMEVFWGAAVNLLQAHGQHIWFLEIRHNGTFELPCRYFYDMIRQLLVLVPNLRSLEVNGWVYETQLDFTVESELDYITNNPLPPLNKLVFMDATVGLQLDISTEDDWTPFELSAAPINHGLLTAYGGQVKRVGMMTKSANETFQWPSHLVGSPSNLTELHLRFPIGMNIFPSIPATHSIKKLTLSSAIHMDQLFPILVAFPNIEVLSINELRCCSKETPAHVVRIETVKGLKINYCPHRDHHYLQNFPNLQYLDLWWRPSLCISSKPNAYTSADGYTYGFHRCIIARAAYETDIWTDLPDLKVVTFKKFRARGKIFKKSYTRDNLLYLRNVGEEKLLKPN